MRLLVEINGCCCTQGSITKMQRIYAESLITSAGGVRSLFQTKIDWMKAQKPPGHLWNAWNEKAFFNISDLAHSPTAIRKARICVRFEGTPVIYSLPPIPL